MARFEEAVTENINRPRRVPEICELIGVTDRTLRSCCAEFIGISPGRYLLLRRLKQVRTALRNTDPTDASVAALARQYGFTELGRFAQAYRRAFGETPFDTLEHMRGPGFLGQILSDSA
jgi:transcriptional regulator GlxA family with amidase domain